MKDYVLVKSRTITNRSVPVVFQTVTHEFPDGTKDVRELSRSYVFDNYEARMPLEMATKLIEKNPNEYFVDKPSVDSDDATAKQVKELRLLSRGFVNPLTGFRANSKAGLISHIRHSNPEEWKESGGDLDAYLEKYAV